MGKFRFRAVLTAGATAVALAVTPLAAGAETLRDTLIAAYRNSGLLDQNRALLRAADEDVAQAMASLRPVVNWASTVSYARPVAPGADDINSSIELTAQMTVYDFGRNRLAIDAAKETVLATREGLVSVEQQVLLRAVEAFMNVRRNSEFLTLRRNNVRLISEELRAVRDRFEVGEVTRTDVALAEARLASARSGVASAEGALAQSQEEFRAAVGRAPGALVPPASLPQTVKTADEAHALAYRHHPDIRKAQRDVTVAEINIERAKAAMRPTLSLQGRAQWDEDLQGAETLSLNATGPIYQGGALTSAVRQASARRDAARAGLLLTKQAIGQQAGNAMANLRVAAASRVASDEQIRAARVAFAGVREEASLGTRTTLDVLDAEQELLDAQTSRISATVDEQIAAYNLLSAMGLLTVTQLELGIETYDPAAYYNLVKKAPAKVSRQGQQLDRVLRALGKQ